jgi:hypothetical protein
MEWMEFYQEYGTVGVMVAIAVWMIVRQGKTNDRNSSSIEDLTVENRAQSETLENMEGMIIKIIDRFNQTDNDADRRFENTTENADRRHEKLSQELRTQSNELFYIKGKMDASK